MNTPNPSFWHFAWNNDLLLNYQGDEHPCKLYAIVGSQTFHFNPNRSYFIFQYAGYSFIDGKYPLQANCYASCADPFNAFLHGNDDAQAIIIESPKTPGTFLLGGPIESEGRLKYIDGCTDSLLLPPWRLGEPCLNHLHFPAGIKQTMHTHPSVRIGIVTKGSGLCVTPFGDIPLTPGMIFVILPENGHQATGTDGKFHDEGAHCFYTFDEEMDVIAFHPDSDYGPRDEDHPMINRTIVNGMSAKNITEIRTK